MIRSCRIFRINSRDLAQDSMSGLGFRVFERAWGLGLGCKVRVLGLGFRISGLGSRAYRA